MYTFNERQELESGIGPEELLNAIKTCAGHFQNASINQFFLGSNYAIED